MINLKKGGKELKYLFKKMWRINFDSFFGFSLFLDRKKLQNIDINIYVFGFFIFELKNNNNFI